VPVPRQWPNYKVLSSAGLWRRLRGSQPKAETQTSRNILVSYETIYELKIAGLDVFVTDMQIFTFMSVIAKVRGYTSDKTGRSLPVEFAPWHMTGRTETMVTATTDPVARAIRRDGYFLVSVVDAPGRRRSEAERKVAVSSPPAGGRTRRFGSASLHT
jgi:hypothetical protein